MGTLARQSEIGVWVQAPGGRKGGRLRKMLTLNMQNLMHPENGSQCPHNALFQRVPLEMTPEQD